MSVLSRAAAPAATSDVAAAVAALLTDLTATAPADLLAGAPRDTVVTGETDTAAPVSSEPAHLLGPSGLGAAALVLPSMLERGAAAVVDADHVAPDDDELPPAAAAPAVVAPTADPPAAAEPLDTARPIPRIPTGPTGFGSAGTGVGSSPRITALQDSGEIGSGTADSDASAAIPAGPSGLGSASAYLHRPRGGSVIPPLYCPPPVRDNPALAEQVNEGIIAWAEQIGLYEGRLDELRAADFGRLIMLAHPDSDDADRLLAVAKCAVSEWSVDDYYCEEDADDRAPDGSPSSAEAELGPRLELAAAVMDPVHLPARYAPQLEQALQADPILRAFRTSFEHMAHFASPAQVARLRTEIAGWFIALAAEAGWRAAKRMPPVWEYLTNRQPHSFLPCICPADAVGGYELSAAEYSDPRVRRVVTTAALAAQMVNDLYSMAREDLSNGREFNLPTVLAAEENCSRREAVQRTAEVHDELMHRFEREATVLAAAGSPDLRRYLTGVWNWMGGNRAWHADSKRYQ